MLILLTGLDALAHPLDSVTHHLQPQIRLNSILTRREFILRATLMALTPLIGCSDVEEKPQSITDLQTLLDKAVEDPKIPGVSAALVQGERLLWSGVAGYADLHSGIKFTTDHLLNIASVSKTITATAIMQQVERGELKLDGDVNDYLGFSVRNPEFPTIPITIRHLLVHRSSITDGPAYRDTYACGDPAVALGVWVEEYLTPGGKYFNASENFLDWAPGTLDPPTSPRAYSNVAFGLLGHLVERASGKEFTAYCREEIFDVLGMKNTRWTIGDVSQHALPHTYLEEGMKLQKGESLSDYLVAESVEESDIVKGSVIPHCLYSFYNYPDGMLRTSPAELASFLRACINGGQLDGKRILKESTVKGIFKEQYAGQGLAWVISNSPNGGRIFHHGGGDPGVSTFMAFRERDGAGLIVFFNCSNPGEHEDRIIDGIVDLLTHLEKQP